jgi:hypothetical protein
VYPDLVIQTYVQCNINYLYTSETKIEQRDTAGYIPTQLSYQVEIEYRSYNTTSILYAQPAVITTLGGVR